VLAVGKGVAVLVVLAVVLGFLAAYFLFSPGGEAASAASPKINVLGVAATDVSKGKVYVRILGDPDETYVVDIVVSGDVSKSYSNVIVKKMGVTDFPIDVPPEKIMKGCTIEVNIVFQGKVIASKTLHVKI